MTDLVHATLTRDPARLVRVLSPAENAAALSIQRGDRPIPLDWADADEILACLLAAADPASWLRLVIANRPMALRRARLAGDVVPDAIAGDDGLLVEYALAAHEAMCSHLCGHLPLALPAETPASIAERTWRDRRLAEIAALRAAGEVSTGWVHYPRPYGLPQA